MSYIDPQEVLSPRDVIQSHRVLYDSGPTACSWSVALLNYWDGTQKVGIRWNGDDNSKIGNPQSHGKPTWYVVPDDLAPIVREWAEQRQAGLLDGYRAMARDEQQETEAMDWIEGLIGDSTDQEG